MINLGSVVVFTKPPSLPPSGGLDGFFSKPPSLPPSDGLGGFFSKPPSLSPMGRVYV